MFSSKKNLKWWIICWIANSQIKDYKQIDKIYKEKFNLYWHTSQTNCPINQKSSSYGTLRILIRLLTCGIYLLYPLSKYKNGTVSHYFVKNKFLAKSKVLSIISICRLKNIKTAKRKIILKIWTQKMAKDENLMTTCNSLNIMFWTWLSAFSTAFDDMAVKIIYSFREPYMH